LAVAQLAVYLHGHSVAFKTFGRVLGAYNSKSQALAPIIIRRIDWGGFKYLSIASEAGSTSAPPKDQSYEKELISCLKTRQL
jgi:hypothetical protein